MFFLWDDVNTSHIAKHNVEWFEAEFVVKRAKRPYPRSLGAGKYQVRGRTQAGRMLQIIYVCRAAEHVDFTLLTPAERLALIEGESATYIIHARDLRRGET
jgi:uncharacterized DUF497 family protein